MAQKQTDMDLPLFSAERHACEKTLFHHDIKYVRYERLFIFHCLCLNSFKNCIHGFGGNLLGISEGFCLQFTWNPCRNIFFVAVTSGNTSHDRKTCLAFVVQEMLPYGQQFERGGCTSTRRVRQWQRCVPTELQAATP